MIKNILIYFAVLISLSSCVETVVVGTVVVGAVVLNKNNLPFDLNKDSKSTNNNKSSSELNKDSKIKAYIKELYKDDEDSESYKNINIDVFEGKVMLTGYVSDKTYKQNAYNKARTAKEGIEVLNEIIIFDSDHKINSMNDSFISMQISIRLKSTIGITSGNYEYAVVDGTVFIIGRSESRDEMLKTTDTISKTKGVKKVITYITISKNNGIV